MTQQPQTTEYPLYFIDGESGMYWSLDHRGIALSPGGVSFTSETGRHDVPFADIRSIRIHTTFAGSGETPIGICQIRFRQYRKLTIYSGDSYGRADEDQRGHYIGFVRDFHRRIPAQDRERIAFNGGLSNTRHMVVSWLSAPR